MNVGLQPRFTSLLLCYFVPLRLCYFATLSLLVSHSSLQKFALFFIILYPGINLWAIYASPILAFFDFFFLFFSFPFSFFLVTLLLCCFVTLCLCHSAPLPLCSFVPPFHACPEPFSCAQDKLRRRVPLCFFLASSLYPLASI